MLLMYSLVSQENKIILVQNYNEHNIFVCKICQNGLLFNLKKKYCSVLYLKKEKIYFRRASKSAFV